VFDISSPLWAGVSTAVILMLHFTILYTQSEVLAEIFTTIYQIIRPNKDPERLLY
jgi:hypothetical protein